MTASVPSPRRPRCLRHTRWLASCGDCADQHRPTSDKESAR